ncbi:MAG: isoprenyl transferase [Flavobacteriales bacterium]|jgi:undecaprenyl diphosphate synthase|nr:isoprenyl transferase [Flavobacteriales bacterium]
MTELDNNIDKKNVPKHVAVIMDGNGRWAKKQGMKRIFGHKNGVKAVRETIETAAKLGIRYLTMYAFSTENWNRPKLEVNALMDLLVNTLQKELPTLQKNNIRLETIGNTEDLPTNCRKNLQDVIEKTKDNEQLTVVLALSYSARWETAQVLKKLALDIKEENIHPDEINEETFRKYSNTKNYPDPELLIRTSGEQRLSNFLLWQLAYSEFIFVEKLWPEFRGEDLIACIERYQNRERRFGKTSEQIN